MRRSWVSVVWVGLVLPLLVMGCATPIDGCFRPTAPPEVPVGRGEALAAAREVMIDGAAVSFHLPDGPARELVRLSVDGHLIPRGLLLWATIEWAGDQRGLVLDDEPGQTGRIGLRRHDPRWNVGDIVVAGGTDLWVGLEAVAWSGAAGLEHRAGRATSGRRIEPFLPMNFPHDRLVGLPEDRAVVTVYLVSPRDPLDVTPLAGDVPPATHSP